MKTFEYLQAADPAEAVAAVANRPGAGYLGGGTNVVDHLKLGILAPELLVDVSRLPLDRIEPVADLGGGRSGIRIGAAVRNSDLAADPVVRGQFPAISRALLSGASGQIRNQATTAGNLLQATRCVYFQDRGTPCNKREPGSGCSALEGYGRYNAILGADRTCVATHPSDLAVALAALDATVVVLGPDGERRIAFGDLYSPPAGVATQDTSLRPADLILAVEVPDSAMARSSTYRKVRDRASFAFALVSVAIAMEVEGDTIGDLRIAWGGVARGPWRARRVEQALMGQPAREGIIRDVIAQELAEAVLTEQTAYKVPMLVNATTVALLDLAGEVRG